MEEIEESIALRRQMKKLGRWLSIVIVLLWATQAYAGSVYVPSRLSEMSDDATHRVVTDTEKNTWNTKPPVTTHFSVTLASTYGCASGWQAGALASEVASLVAVGINADYIFCVDVSAGNINGSVAPSGFASTVSLGSVTVAGQRNQGISPSGFAMTAFLGIPSISTAGGASLNPAGLTMTASLGTATVSGIRNQTISPTGLYATASLGTATVSGGASATNVSDNFNRAGANPIGGNWTTFPSGCKNNLQIVGNQVTGVGDNSGAYWNANTFADNQYSEAKIISVGSGGPTYTNGPAVRQTNCTYYAGVLYTWIGDSKNYWQLWKVVNATATQLGSQVQVDDPIMRLEANGSTITLYSLTTHGGTKTSRISVTDTAITSGQAGFTEMDGTYSWDDWYGGDL